MRKGRDELIYMALMALDEIAETCGRAPAQKTWALRFILAWLFEASGADPDRKWMFEHFWKDATRSGGEYLQCVARETGAQSALNGITRACGWERDVPFLHEMSARRKRKG
jgi:hypothetical protein